MANYHGYFKASMSLVSYAVRVTTDEALYNETYGMTSTGVFCWITGNPGFTGIVSNGATGEAGLTGVDIRWNEGWMTRDGLENPTREIDISIAGNYGTQSGFDFSLADSKAGVGSQFRKFVADNDIKFTGRKVEMFTVLDKVFYRTWTGKVANNPVDETQFRFSCDDTYKQIHKQLPPIAITKSNFPNATDTGKFLPVCLGDVPYAECMQVTEDAKRIPLAESYDGQEYETVPLYHAFDSELNIDWDASSGNTGISYIPTATGLFFYYDLWTEGKQFETGAFRDGTFYLNVTSGTDPISSRLDGSSYLGDFPDTAQLVPIIESQATLPMGYAPADRLRFMTRIYTKEPIAGYNQCLIYLHDLTLAWEPTVRIADEVLANQNMYVQEDDRYFLSIVRLPTEYIVSTAAVHAFKPGDTSQIQLLVYNSGNLTWDDVSHNVLNNGAITAEGYQSFKAPHGLVGQDLMPCGVENYASLVPFKIPKVELIYNSQLSSPQNGAVLNSGSREKSIKSSFNTGLSTYIEQGLQPVMMRRPPAIIGTAVDCLTFDMYITDELRTQLKDAGLSELYLVPDFYIQPSDAATTTTPSLFFSISMYPMTVQGLRLETSAANYQANVCFPTSGHFPYDLGTPKEAAGLTGMYYTNFIPSKYWRMCEWDAADDTYFDQSYDNLWDLHAVGTRLGFYWDIGEGSAYSFRYRDAWRLKFLSDIISDTRIQRIRVKIGGGRFSPNSPAQKWNTAWFQFALVGRKSVDIAERGIFTRVAGEKHLGVQTNNVYTTFRKILEGYDGVALADIDYGNLPWARQNWHVGRQLTDQKSSFEYLQELARQSYVGIVPKRDGRRKLSAWREDTASPLAHNSDSIVREGMESWEQTPLSDCFNEFTLQYNYDPGAKAYTRNLFVGKVDGTWPGAAGAWGEYVGSSVVAKDESSESGELSGAGAYPDCKDIWDVCRESWQRSRVVSKEQGTDYSNLPWYIDYSDYDPNDTNTYQGVDSSAWKYLRQLTQWATRQKDVVTYRIPLTAANLQATELLEPVAFCDPIWSANAARAGWITRVTVDTNKDQIIVTTMLEPTTIYEDKDDVIEEIGSVNGALLGDPIYEETGSADIIEETGVI